MKTKMERMVLLILALLLILDLAEDGCLGKVKVYLPHPSTNTSVTSSHHHPDSAKTDIGPELALKDWPGIPRPGNARLVTLRLPATLQIIKCCHLCSSGGIPL
jgi:hypothetical protein